MPCRITKMVRCIISSFSKCPKILAVALTTQYVLVFYLALQKLLLRHHPGSHESIASLLQKMGMMQFRAGNLDSALLYLEKSVETYREVGGGHETKVIPALFVIGNIHNILKHALDAEQAWRDAYEVFGSLKSETAYLYPEIKGSLTELLDVRRGHVS